MAFGRRKTSKNDIVFIMGYPNIKVDCNNTLIRLRPESWWNIRWDLMEAIFHPWMGHTVLTTAACYRSRFPEMCFNTLQDFLRTQHSSSTVLHQVVLRGPPRRSSWKNAFQSIGHSARELSPLSNVRPFYSHIAVWSAGPWLMACASMNFCHKFRTGVVGWRAWGL